MISNFIVSIELLETALISFFGCVQGFASRCCGFSIGVSGFDEGMGLDLNNELTTGDRWAGVQILIELKATFHGHCGHLREMFLKSVDPINH